MWKRLLKKWIPVLRHRPTVLRLRHFMDRLRGTPAALHAEWRPKTAASRRVRRVVFVADAPLRREPKFAYALKKAGWEIILLHRQPIKFNDVSDFADIQQYSFSDQAVRFAREARPSVIHAFANHFDSTTMRIVDNKFCPVAVDFYDMFFAMSDNSPEKKKNFSYDIAMQKKCLERADGICCPDLQMQYDRRTTRLGRGKPLILFPNYCWNREEIPERKTGDDIHIVQSGWIHLETAGNTDIGGFQVVREFVNAGCHFHMYQYPYADDPAASAHLAQAYADYLELREKTGRVHFHKTVPTDLLIRELVQYDYGLNMQNAGSFNIPLTNENPRWLPLLASGRMFDYLDAGLGMLTDGILAFNRHLFRGSGAVYDGPGILHSGRIREVLAERPTREAMLKARASLAVERHIPRLIRFYESL